MPRFCDLLQFSGKRFVVCRHGALSSFTCYVPVRIDSSIRCVGLPTSCLWYGACGHTIAWTDGAMSCTGALGEQRTLESAACVRGGCRWRGTQRSSTATLSGANVQRSWPRGNEPRSPRRCSDFVQCFRLLSTVSCTTSCTRPFYRSLTQSGCPRVWPGGVRVCVHMSIAEPLWQTVWSRHAACS